MNELLLRGPIRENFGKGSQWKHRSVNTQQIHGPAALAHIRLDVNMAFSARPSYLSLFSSLGQSLGLHLRSTQHRSGAAVKQSEASLRFKNNFKQNSSSRSLFLSFAGSLS